MNRLVLTGMEMARIGRVALFEKLAAWVTSTGVRNVSSGVIRCDALPYKDLMVYSCHYDSAHWTGRGFKGFDHKHPGEPPEVPYTPYEFGTVFEPVHTLAQARAIARRINR